MNISEPIFAIVWLSIAFILLPATAFAGVAESISEIANQVPLEGAVIIVATILVDLFFRFIPTEKARSIITFVRDGLKFLVAVLQALVLLVQRVSDFTDRIIGQRSKDESSKLIEKKP